MTEVQTGSALKTLEISEVKKELAISDPTAMLTSSPVVDKDLDAKADAFVTTLISLNPEDVASREKGTQAAETMGLDVQKQAAKQMEMLKAPIRALSSRGEEGGDVAKSLTDLKLKVEDLDPSRVSLEPGWFSRMVGALPGVGTPLKRYFTKFESAQTVIASIVASLERGKDQLTRDNITLLEDQKRMREMTHLLERSVKLGQLVDQKLQYRLERDIPATDPRAKFLAEELLFPLRQRILDLQQQLAVNQQGVIASEIVIRNNKELIRGVNRSLQVTVTALNVGATVALALANQKIVLDKIQAVSQTTSDLIAGTAARLKTQGAAIHKQASEPMVQIDSLKSAFADLKSAVDDISAYRINALPKLASAVLEMDKMSQDAEQSIRKIEEGNRQRPNLELESSLKL